MYLCPNIEEAVQSSTVNPDVVGILNCKSISHVAPGVICAECGISWVTGHPGSILGGLVVGGLSLNGTHENVGSFVEVVVVVHVVF